RYDAWFEKHPYAYLSELEALKRCVGGGVRLGLEVGVGGGRFSQPLGIQFGVDPSLSMLREARLRGVEVVRGVGERLPFTDSVFDLVLMVTTICFLDDVDASFLEVKRVLKRGGKFTLGFIDGESELGKKLKTRRDNPFYAEATLYSVREVLAHLERAGFREYRTLQTIFQDPENISTMEPVKEGYGEGSFVVVCAKT
ncbi:MAG: methyltransferase domain-containing protein, partial [Thermoprotei archaeon]